MSLVLEVIDSFGMPTGVCEFIGLRKNGWGKVESFDAIVLKQGRAVLTLTLVSQQSAAFRAYAQALETKLSRVPAASEHAVVAMLRDSSFMLLGAATSGCDLFDEVFRRVIDDASGFVVVPGGVFSSSARVASFDSVTSAPPPASAPDSPVRRESLQQLTELGFRPVVGLPLTGATTLRPPLEIAERLSALVAVYSWVALSDEEFDSSSLREFLARSDLTEHLTESESLMLRTPRGLASQRFASTIGWRLENMWPLAWVLGFEQNPVGGLRQIPHDVSAALSEFVPESRERCADWLRRQTPRPAHEVLALEDFFYCAHNAVRQAQFFDRTAVPAGYHPVSDGGVVHERRHALTWCVSPGTTWDETDLSS